MVSIKKSPIGLKISEKQAEVLAFIDQEISRQGRPPTFRDIAKHCGGLAVGTAQDHVRALIQKGYLEKEEGRARGLRPSYHAESTSVPILGSVPAGHPIEAIEDIQGSLSVPSRIRGELFALRVKGESMIEAGILDGDFVIVRKQDHAEHGEIVVAMIDGEATIKRLEKKQGRMRLIPANPRFEPIDILSENSVIQGKVVSLQRHYS